jgi:Glutamine amidotransferases class-II
VQVVITHNEGVKGAELEREFFLLRKLVEGEKARRISAAPDTAPTTGPSASDLYICSLSNKTIVYKACPGPRGLAPHAVTGSDGCLCIFSVWVDCTSVAAMHIAWPSCSPLFVILLLISACFGPFFS